MRTQAGRGFGLFVLGVALGACTCARTPPEPAGASSAAASSPPTTASTASSTPSSAAGSPSYGADRCVRLTPATPPPAAAPAPEGRCPKDPGAPGPLPVKTLAFPEASSGLDASPSAVSLEAEVARSDEESERGLMYRQHMADDHGMIFALGERKEHVFWMRNTCIPLDMVFVDDDGLIVGILENVPTLNDEERTVGCPSTFVIETNAGGRASTACAPAST